MSRGTPDCSTCPLNERFDRFEQDIGEIKRALIGTLDGDTQGLMQRVAKLEDAREQQRGWGRWVGGIVAAAIGGTLGVAATTILNYLTGKGSKV